MGPITWRQRHPRQGELGARTHRRARRQHSPEAAARARPPRPTVTCMHESLARMPPACPGTVPLARGPLPLCRGTYAAHSRLALSLARARGRPPVASLADDAHGKAAANLGESPTLLLAPRRVRSSGEHLNSVGMEGAIAPLIWVGRILLRRGARGGFRSSVKHYFLMVKKAKGYYAWHLNLPKMARRAP